MPRVDLTDVARKRLSARRWIAAGTLVVAAAFLGYGFRERAFRPRPLERLARADRKRLIEARLTGFAWAAMVPTRGNPATADPETTHIAAGILRDVDESSAESGHDAAIARLLLGDTGAAASALRLAARDTPSARLWNDAAAASYTSALATASPEELIHALVAADAALRLDAAMPEARFNRALVIERLGLRDVALAEWNRYLRFDSSSGWASEARAHAARLSDTSGDFAELLERQYSRIPADPDLAAEIGARFAQDLRTSGDTEILGRWGEAELKADSAAAALHLSVARTFGRLAAARGDELLSRTVAAIDAATPERRRVLAAAHVDFHAGRQKFQQLKPAEAEPFYARAAAGFERGASPAVVLARAFRANMLYEQGHVDEAATELSRLLESLPREFRSCGAQIQWELSLCHSVRGRYGDAIEAAKASMETFQQIGETNYAASMNLMLAWIYDLIGDGPAARRLRMTALPLLGRKNTRVLHAAVGSIAQTAILRQDWAVAESFLGLQHEAAQLANNDTFVTDAFLRRALVRRRLGRHDAARRDLAYAKELMPRIADDGIRLRFEGRLLWVEGDLADDPTAKIALLTRAIDVHRTAVRRMTLPSLLYDRAVAWRAAGDLKNAAADLDTAIWELESHRASLPGVDTRWGVFHGAEEIFDEAVDLALQQGDVDGAFRYAEAARARTLLDALRSMHTVSRQDMAAATAIIEYVATPSHLFIFFVDRSGVRAVQVTMGRATLADTVAALRRALPAGDTNAADASARKLGAVLIEPVAGWLAPNDTLVLVPDATLNDLPFVTLKMRNGRYVIEAHPVVVSPSAAVYAHVARRARPANEGRLVALANDDAAGREVLSSALGEATAIAKRYRRAIFLSGREATVDAFRRSVSQAETIHFAGHALTSEWTPEETFLVLKNADGAEERLDLREIAELKLERSPTVVLAACNTAVGRTTPLEGTMSAARAFLAAGASSVVATLWPVDDRQSAAFFVRLHEHLARGEAPAHALRNTQIESIRAGVPPSMWGAVRLMGK